jgi:hypothetical protein
VIFAAIGGMPMATRTGKVMSVPPPAMALVNPAASAAIKAYTRFISCIRIFFVKIMLLIFEAIKKAHKNMSLLFEK